MFQLIVFFTLILSFSQLSLAERKSYENYNVYEITVGKNIREGAINYLMTNEKLDFWSLPKKIIGHPSVVMVHKDEEINFLGILNSYQIPYKLLITNVEETIEKERQYHMNKSKAKPLSIYDQYLTSEEINAYIAELASNNSNIVEVKSIGTSYEGRVINSVRVSSDLSQTKPAIFMEAGIHAREWIAPALALYILTELTKTDNRGLIENVEWLIIPSSNPDGYSYTWTMDRMWRKTRTPGQFCDGVDANRNFNFHWMENGASDYECDEVYGGPEPSSEKEVQAIANFMTTNTNIILYLSIHSYGQYIIYPWSWTFDPPENVDELDSLGNAMANAIYAVGGTEYTVGGSTPTLYYAAGCSDDYAMGVANISLVFVIELPGGGSNGFDMPPDGILPVCQETWPGILVLYDYVTSLNLN